MKMLTFILMITLLFSLMYTFLMFINISQGKESISNNNNSSDLHWNEYISFMMIILMTMLLGLFPWMLLLI